jgi:17beta-estradiol 17-dehydrogenase / very-long-chain 3-oxoacyl-CoA reductase
MSWSGLEVIGLIVTVYVMWCIVGAVWNLLYTCYIGSALGRAIDVRRLGSWAVVTGATDGLGRAYVDEMARKGLNVVLISRSLFKLQNVAREVEKQHGVKTRVIDVDFTEDDHIYEKIGVQLQDLDVGVLINNVGMSYSYPEFLSYLPDAGAFCTRLMHCNILSVTGMTLLLLPKMAEKRKGLILNVSSASAVLPSPLLTMYSSCKAFVEKFSRDLSLECQHLGVTVQCVLPGFVATNMSRFKSSLTVPSPKQFVRGHMNTLGLEASSPGYWVHKIQIGLYNLGLLFVRPIVERLAWYGLFSIRTRAVRRQQRLKASAESLDKFNHNAMIMQSKLADVTRN